MVSVEPPVRVQVEVSDGAPGDGLAEELEAAIRARLTFRARIELVVETAFGASGYKTPLTVTRSGASREAP
jgi:hypothetical protein